MKKLLCAVVLLGLCMSMAVTASLRARYTVPRYHKYYTLQNMPVDTLKNVKIDTVKNLVSSTAFSTILTSANTHTRDTFFMKDTVFYNGVDTIKYKRSWGKNAVVTITDYAYPAKASVTYTTTDSVFTFFKTARDTAIIDLAADTSYWNTIQFHAQAASVEIIRHARFVCHDTLATRNAPPNDTMITGSYYGSWELGWQYNTYWPMFEANVWDNYDPDSAFDRVGMDLGSIANAPVVDSRFWLDSCFEPRNGNNAAYTAENVLKVKNDSLLASEGEIVAFYGGIRFPKTGVWTLYSSGDDARTPISIDLNGDGKFNDTTETESFANSFNADSLTARGWTSYIPDSTSGLDYYNLGRYRMIKDFHADSGKFYKFQGWQWNYSQVSYSAVFWKRPDSAGKSGKIEVVPSWAFGIRKNFGRPKAHIIGISKDSADIITVLADTMWYKNLKIYDSTALIITGSAQNLLGGGAKYVFTWGDGKIDTTTNNTALHIYHYDPAVFLIMPSLQVIRVSDSVISSPAPEAPMFNGPKRCNPVGSCRAPIVAVKSPLLHGIKSQNVTLMGQTLIIRYASKDMEVALYSIAGSKVMSKKIGVDGFASINLKRLGIASGFYVVNVLNNGAKVRSLPVMIK